MSVPLARIGDSPVESETTVKQFVRSLAVNFFRSMRVTTGYVPPERIFKHLHFEGPFEVRFPDKSSLTLYSWGNRVENELAWRGWDGHEPYERRMWAAMVREGGDILDIGANTATFALTAKSLSPQSRVIAFEPIARIADLARHNIATAGVEIEVVGMALARESGILPIYDPGGRNAYSASLSKDFLPGAKDCYDVPVTSLDAFCEERGIDPVAIKLDVEGFEGEVLCGAAALLERGRCLFLCEWLCTSDSHAEALGMLQEAGYVALDVRGLAEVDLAAEHRLDDRNVLLVHRNRVAECRSWSVLN